MSDIIKVNFANDRVVKIYPNSASNVMHIDLTESSSTNKVLIIDAAGRQVLSSKLTNK